MSTVREGAREPEGQVVSLEVPARPGYVVLARLALSAVCRLTPLPDEDVADLKLAVTEAANSLVGDSVEDEPAEGGDPSEERDVPRASGPLRPLADPAAEGTLRFRFDLGERQLAIDIHTDGAAGAPEDERELSHAIIAATVDDFRIDERSVRLVKRLVGRSE